MTDANLGEIVQTSANTEALLGRAPETLLGVELVSLLGQSGVEQLETLLAAADPYPVPLVLESTLSTGTAQFQVAAWQTDNCIVVELEPWDNETPEVDFELGQVNQVLAEIERNSDANQVQELLVDAIRRITGFHRVMLYVFDKEWNGTVVAESRSADAETYLGLRFPASDIPPQARAIYARNPVRLIPDTEAVPAALVPARNPLTQGDTDLGRGTLRAVSPVHLRYLRNMGVRASMSVGIRRDGVLWGLVACHAADRHRVPGRVREAAVAIARAVAHRIFTLDAEAERAFRLDVWRLRMSMVQQASKFASVDVLFRDHASELRRVFSACGAALVQNGQVVRIERAPGKRAILQLVDWLGQRNVVAAWFTSHSAEIDVNLDAERAAGVLAIPLDLRPGQEWLLLFRPEIAETVVWAGNPLGGEITGEGLSPRESFSTWQAEQRGQSADWSDQAVEAAREVAHELAVIASAEEIRELNERLRQERRALSEANQQLEQLATTDRLTGAWNRYRVEQAMQEELQRSERQETPFSLLVFDIDFFKRVNDVHGHSAGDEVLRVLSRVTMAVVRETDRFARWGGEEFVILAIGSDASGGFELAERLRAAIDSTDFPVVGHVTVSVGVATWQPEDTLDSIFQRADRGLYTAKQTGRNRVCVAPS